MIISENGDGTWSMGKKERISTFKLDEEWEENWGQVTAKNKVQIKGQTLSRQTVVDSMNKTMHMTIEAFENGGVKVTQSCGDVVATRIFSKL